MDNIFCIYGSVDILPKNEIVNLGRKLKDDIPRIYDAALDLKNLLERAFFFHFFQVLSLIHLGTTRINR